ncbi:hypothetical protein ACN38_g11782, partial [Penicillium nordicum]
MYVICCRLSLLPLFAICYLFAIIEQCSDGFAGYINPCI